VAKSFSMFYLEPVVMKCIFCAM